MPSLALLLACEWTMSISTCRTDREPMPQPRSLAAAGIDSREDVSTEGERMIESDERPEERNGGLQASSGRIPLFTRQDPELVGAVDERLKVVGGAAAVRADRKGNIEQKGSEKGMGVAGGTSLAPARCAEALEAGKGATLRCKAGRKHEVPEGNRSGDIPAHREETPKKLVTW